jgi:protein phosphatase
MLVCPHCQFENPDTHKFCQECGGSLAEMDCPHCGASVPFSAEKCPQCGTATGTFWQAIVSLPQAPEPESEGQLTEAPVPFPVDGKFLDAQQRYQIVEPLPQPAMAATEIEVRVIDCQPFQPSLIEALYQSIDTIDNVSDAEPASENTPLLTIPSVAQPYLDLQEHYPSLPVPQIHDAWEQEGLSVVLLGDRSNLPLLLDLWSSDDILPLQTLHWLHEMVELWTALQPLHCCQSLLKLSNLRVDEDYLLCLQRLHFDPPQNPATLQDLGQIWRTLFEQSQRTQNSNLSLLCRDLEVGEVTSIEQLRSRIETIAASLQSDGAPMPPFPEFESLDASDSYRSDVMQHPNDALAATEPSAAADDFATQSADEAGNEAGNDLLDPVEQGEAVAIDDGISDNDDLPTVVLPMRLMSIEDAGLTDIGRQRDHNEDCFSIQTEIKKLESPQGRSLQAKGLYILCDGMGGHAGGEVASALAVETLHNYFAEHWQDKLPSEESIRESIYMANHVLYDLNQKNASSGSGRMGTTLVMVLIQDTEAAIAHVGDSRLYRFSRRQGLEQITTDHEVGQREIQRGVEPAIAYARPDAYQLTQALGPRDENFINPDVKFLELNEDILLLLCSDGLTDNNLLENHWQTHLEPLLSCQSNLEQGVNQLVELANHYNGHDNITVVAIRTVVRPNLDQIKRS